MWPPRFISTSSNRRLDFQVNTNRLFTAIHRWTLAKKEIVPLDIALLSWKKKWSKRWLPSSFSSSSFSSSSCLFFVKLNWKNPGDSLFQSIFQFKKKKIVACSARPLFFFCFLISLNFKEVMNIFGWRRRRRSSRWRARSVATSNRWASNCVPFPTWRMTAGAGATSPMVKGGGVTN